MQPGLAGTPGSLDPESRALSTGTPHFLSKYESRIYFQKFMVFCIVEELKRRKSFLNTEFRVSGFSKFSPHPTNSDS